VPDHSIQSALHPAGTASAAIAGLWWFIFGLCGIVFLVVMGLLLAGLLRRSRHEPAIAPGGGNRFVVIGGAVIPAILLVTMLLASLKTTVALKLPRNDLTVQVIGHQWWWEVRYPRERIRTANEIGIPVGRPVQLELSSADVIHSFWVPSLNGKMDLIPGHRNLFWIAADRPGLFRGQCAEYCGLQHAHMAFYVKALPPEQFRAWVAARQRPHPSRSSPRLARGQQIITLAGCKDCHTIQGTGATGTLGPDLTHVGSRLSLGAGALDNNAGSMEGWIEDSQSIKPGNKMPRMYLTPDDLHAVREYLQSLD
jgi:cytochrome c oxidase subunit 2